MNIDEMPAGRELDALVAEKVMGYECVCDDEPRDCPIHAREDYDTLLAYSTDIAAAKGVVEKMQFLVLTNDDETGTLWTVTDHDTVTVTSSTIETMPLTICHAALKLMEGSNEDYQPTD